MLKNLPEIRLSRLRLFLAMMGIGIVIFICGTPAWAEIPVTIESIAQSLDSPNERDRIKGAQAIATLKPFSPQVLSLLYRTLKDESEHF